MYPPAPLPLPVPLPEDPGLKWLKSALSLGRLSHGLIFKGSNPAQLYQTALWLGQTLNCETPVGPSEPCGTCRNCRWALDNAHPSLISLSPHTYPSQEMLEGKKAHTQIYTSQISQLLGQLALSSQAQRLIIVADAEVRLPLAVSEGVAPLALPYQAPYEWRMQHLKQEGKASAKAEKQLVFLPLTSGVFHAEAANKLLKTLEEPPANTRFVFLVQDEGALMETIVSRCQVVGFASQPQPAEGACPLLWGAFWQKWWPQAVGVQSVADPYETIAELEAFATEQSTPLEDALGYLQGYLHQTLHQTVETAALPGVNNYLKTQALLTQAKDYLQAKAHAKSTLLQLLGHLRQLA